VTYNVEFMEAAKKQLVSIKDRRIREKIVERAEALAVDPEKQGKELGGDLEGYRSIRAVGQRYRIVYRVDGENVVVVVVALGIRKEGDKKDVYKLTQRLFKLGLLDDEPPPPEMNEGESQEDLTEESPESQGEESS
jgi:mRNA interferase RelE/StbE